MLLHNYPNEFKDLVAIVADQMHLPESAIERDYYIVYLLKNLVDSDYSEQCVFKGGTSLSKCYPGSIERFSEDIDLTFLGMELSDKECDRMIKRIESVMTSGAETEKINAERSNRSKSMFVWFNSKEDKIKLEIGSSVRPDPYSKKSVKTYIQEYLERNGYTDAVDQYKLEEIQLNVLDITRTFVDKLMSIKRHAICGSLGDKVRHIYDVYRLYSLPEVQTDSFYLSRRGISDEYDPRGTYDFPSWKHRLTDTIRSNYESLHKKGLLYTTEEQHFGDALKVLEEIDAILGNIGE